MSFLCALCLGLVLSWLRVFAAEILADELLGCTKGKVRKVGRVSSHIRDMTAFVKTLCNAHCLAYRESQLAGCLLLEC